VVDLDEDGVEERLLAAEVVIERALGHLGAGHDRVQRGARVAVLGEQLGGDLEERLLGGGGVLLAPADAGDIGQRRHRDLGHELAHGRLGHSVTLVTPS
jgi:hypothetical protein